MKKSIVWMMIGALVVVALPVAASTFLALSQDEMVEQAEAVVTGRVVEVSSFWNAERTAILTEATLEVESAVVGAAPSYVNLRTFGGQVGDYRIEAHGFPTFERGERLLVFLEPEKDGAYRVFGYQQGQYRIRSERGREIAVPTFDGGATLVRRDGKPAAAAQAVELDQLKQELREAAHRAGRPAVQ